MDMYDALNISRGDCVRKRTVMDAVNTLSANSTPVGVKYMVNGSTEYNWCCYMANLAAANCDKFALMGWVYGRYAGSKADRLLNGLLPTSYDWVYGLNAGIALAEMCQRVIEHEGHHGSMSVEAARGFLDDYGRCIAWLDKQVG